MNVSEVNTGEGVWQVFLCFLGVGEHGMLDIGNRRQPGIPCRVFQEWEYAGQVIIKRGRQMSCRESDDRIVPMKAGNAAGGKAVTTATVLWGNMHRAQ